MATGPNGENGMGTAVAAIPVDPSTGNSCNNDC